MTEEYLTRLLGRKDLEDVLRTKLGNLRVETYRTSPLTAPGDNLGSIIVAVDVDLNHPVRHFRGRAGDRGLSLGRVNWGLLPLSPFLRVAFDCSVTVRKEIYLYTLVAPEYVRLQEERGVPLDKRLALFPELYGARATLREDVGQPVDDGALLILENLKVRGFEVRPRLQGLDLNHAELALRNLSGFHALGIALRSHKPLVFKNTVVKAAAPFRLGPSELEHSLGDADKIVDTLQGQPLIAPHLDKVRDLLRKTVESNFSGGGRQEPRQPFATLIHNDFWCANMMFSYGADGDKDAPTGFKILDFQITRYDSPAKDLLFFLFTSLSEGLREEHFDRLIRYYHENLVGYLTLLGCDADRFSFKRFLEDVDTAASSHFLQTLYLLGVIYAEK
ncbi:unnamed protein product, partial [Timema podura]|nr:unnamed protein product [Timema podura]